MNIYLKLSILMLIYTFCLLNTGSAFAVPPAHPVEVSLGDEAVIERSKKGEPVSAHLKLEIKQLDSWSAPVLLTVAVIKMDDKIPEKKKFLSKTVEIDKGFFTDIKIPLHGVGEYEIEAVINSSLDDYTLVDKDYIYLIAGRTDKAKIFEYPQYLKFRRGIEKKAVRKPPDQGRVPVKADKEELMAAFGGFDKYTATVKGKVTFADTGQPTGSVLVELWDDIRFFPDPFLGVAYTEHDGSFSITFDTAVSYDPPAWPTRHVYAVVKLKNEDLIFRKTCLLTTDEFNRFNMGVLAYDPSIIAWPPESAMSWQMSQRITVNKTGTYTIPDDNLKAVFKLKNGSNVARCWEHIHDAEEYLKTSGLQEPGLVNVCFSVKDDDGYYAPYWNEIALGKNYLDSTFVPGHEYGHAVMDMAEHHKHPARGCPYSHHFGTQETVMCAWSEGWATYYALGVFFANGVINDPHWGTRNIELYSS